MMCRFRNVNFQDLAPKVLRCVLASIFVFEVFTFQNASAGQLVMVVEGGKSQPKPVGKELAVQGTPIRINRYAYEASDTPSGNSPENVIGIWLNGRDFFYITDYEQDGYGNLTEDMDRFVSLNYGLYKDYLILEAYGTGSAPEPYLFLFKIQKKSIKFLDAAKGCISFLQSGKLSTYDHPSNDLLDFNLRHDNKLALRMACGEKADQITYLPVKQDHFKSSHSLFIGHKKNKKTGFRLEKYRF